MDKLRILLADDHAVLREGLAVLINAQPDMAVIAHASDGHSAVRQVGEWQPDVVVMDISMPELNGIAAATQIQSMHPLVHIIILTRHFETGYLQQMLQIGLHGYVLKQAVATELISAIRIVASGGTYFDPKLIAYTMPQSKASLKTGEHAYEIDLSERETDVVRLLAHGYSNKEIANQLGLSVKTVDTYKSRAMVKLQLYGRAALVRYALQRGWFNVEE